MKSYKSKINTSFYDNEIRKEGSHCISLSAILIDSVFKTIIHRCFQKNANTSSKKKR